MREKAIPSTPWLIAIALTVAAALALAIFSWIDFYAMKEELSEPVCRRSKQPL